jgi:hypothetical protein
VDIRLQRTGQNAEIESRVSGLIATTFARNFPMRIRSGVVVPAFIFTSQTHGDPASFTACRIFFAGRTGQLNAVSLGLPCRVLDAITWNPTTRGFAAEQILCGIRIPWLWISCGRIARQSVGSQ